MAGVRDEEIAKKKGLDEAVVTTRIVWNPVAGIEMATLFLVTVLLLWRNSQTKTTNGICLLEKRDSQHCMVGFCS